VFEETLKGFPYSQEAHFGLSNCLLHQADVTFARNAASPDPQVQQAAVETVLSLADRALVHADQAVNGSRRLGAFYHNRSVARYWIARLRDPSQMDAAEQDARTAVSLQPGLYVHLTHLTEILFLRGKMTELRDVLEAYLNEIPDTPYRSEIEAVLAGFVQQD